MHNGVALSLSMLDPDTRQYPVRSPLTVYNAEQAELLFPACGVAKQSQNHIRALKLPRHILKESRQH